MLRSIQNVNSKESRSLLDKDSLKTVPHDPYEKLLYYEKNYYMKSLFHTKFKYIKIPLSI